MISIIKVNVVKNFNLRFGKEMNVFVNYFRDFKYKDKNKVKFFR